RRTEIARIADPAARLVTYSKRRKGLFNKAYELSRLCGARVAVVVFSPAGKPCSFGDPSADEIISDYLRGGGDGGDGDGEVMPPMGLTQWAEWVQTEWDACATEEDLESLILKYEAVRDCARKKLKALEDESQVKVGAGDSHVLTEEEIDAIFESLGRCPALSDLLTDGDGNDLMTSPDNSAAAGGSSAVESIPVRSDIDSCGSNAPGGGRLGMASTPTCSDLEDCGFDPDDFLNLLEECVQDGDRDNFLTSPVESAVGGGNSGVEPALSDREGCGYDPIDFATLEDLGVLL
ncbi:protein MADS AFFECTING FLOWERING 5-like, partial [Syzygium oleosum]|uniref:protein MADS AFFECTING FLOWERING 5-like n=1 Tax=Syzygium oleosum TaxID=219896 RepID=UPI0024BB30C4